MVPPIELIVRKAIDLIIACSSLVSFKKAFTESNN